jgi:DNA replication protein DnaC
MAMSMTEIEKNLRLLRLPGMLNTLESRLLDANSSNLTFINVFSMLLQDEIDIKKSSMSNRRFKSSGLHERKSMSDFDWTFNPQLPKKDCFELLSLKFMEAGDDVIVLGHPGTGKSHFAKAIVQMATEREYRVIYREAHQLFEELFEARQFKTRKSSQQNLVRADLLVIDDLFLRKRVPEDAADNLQEIIMDRYSAKKSTFITSNRIVDDWGKCLGDNVVASAILDRLMHRGHLLKFTGKSYRLKESSKRLLEKSKDKN